MTKDEFNEMFKKLSEMDIKFLFISSRTNDYYGIVGGTMIAFERIIRKYKNMKLILKYYYNRRPPPIYKIFKHPIQSIKPYNYWHYKYLVLKKYI